MGRPVVTCGGGAPAWSPVADLTVRAGVPDCTDAGLRGHWSHSLCLAIVVAAAATMAQYKGAASEAGRAMHLMKKREKQREQMEQMKQRIAEVRAGPGRLRACTPPTAPAPWVPRTISVGGRRALAASGLGPSLADVQQQAEASRRQSAHL